MILTEAEATTKWCPFARVAMSEGPAANDAMPEVLSAADALAFNARIHCKASGCMAWRWRALATDRTEATGFCGLTGHRWEA